MNSGTSTVDRTESAEESGGECRLVGTRGGLAKFRRKGAE